MPARSAIARRRGNGDRNSSSPGLLPWLNHLGASFTCRTRNARLTEYAVLGGPDQTLGKTPDELVKIKFVELPMLGQYAAHRAGDRAHHYCFGLNHVLAEFYPAQHGAAGDPGGGKKAIAFHHIVNLVLTPRVFDAH